MKQLIVFDLDGTLAESKGAIDAEMATLFEALLGAVAVAVISGGNWPQFETQLLGRLTRSDRWDNLSMLPNCGTKFFRYAGAWRQLYSEELSPDQKVTIRSAFAEAIVAADLHFPTLWGEQLEDRGSQMTFSALGQHAPIEEKLLWDPDFAKRQRMQRALALRIPELSVRIGGSTSIDVTRSGIDKAYGIGKLRELLGIPETQMLFVGDALFPGGNDYPVLAAGVTSIRVRDPDETKRVIETLLACLPFARDRV